MRAAPNVAVTFEVTMKLTEGEARALEALVGYGVEEFLKCFYQHMGRAYLAPHEHGLRQLFASVGGQIVPAISVVDGARAAIATKGAL